MRKLLYIIPLLFGLIITSCDRFEHAFKPVITIDINAELFTPLQAAFSTISAGDVSSVMSFYDEEYLHNSQQKSNRENFFLSLFQKSDSLTFLVSLIASLPINMSDSTSTSTWRLRVTDNAKQLIADSTFYDEKLIKRGNSWKLYGNRNQCFPPVSFKQRVVIETFTYTTCSNCPIVEGWLHNLQTANPNNLTYLEYHISGQLNIGNEGVFSYYGIPSTPGVVFQGRNIVLGSNPDNEQIFSGLVAQLANEDSKIDLTNLGYQMEGNTLAGNVVIQIKDQSIDQTQLNLKYAIIDKETNPLIYHNDDNEPCRNVVLAKGTKSLLNADLSLPVNFNIPFGSLPAGYNGSLPLDSYLVVWVQINPNPFINNASIYNALEAPITVNKYNRTK